MYSLKNAESLAATCLSSDKFMFCDRSCCDSSAATCSTLFTVLFRVTLRKLASCNFVPLLAPNPFDGADRIIYIYTCIRHLSLWLAFCPCHHCSNVAVAAISLHFQCRRWTPVRRAVTALTAAMGDGMRSKDVAIRLPRDERTDGRTSPGRLSLVLVSVCLSVCPTDCIEHRQTCRYVPCMTTRDNVTAIRSR